MTEAKEGADDLAVLFPDRRLSIDGVDVLVRELRFEEQLANHHLLKPIADAFAAMPPESFSDPAAVNTVLDLLAEHWTTVRQLVALSCGQSVEWVGALRPQDGEALLLTWWAANQGFFVRRLLRPALVRQAIERAGGASLPASSPQGTTGGSSAAIRAGS
jgi:hypothetical protein